MSVEDAGRQATTNAFQPFCKGRQLRKGALPTQQQRALSAWRVGSTGERVLRHLTRLWHSRRRERFL
jgi:hypothetical protein